MLGLLVKDLRIALTRKFALLIILVIALIMGTSMEGPFIIGYVTMIALMLAVGTIIYDEMDNGYDFMMTMPLTRKTYVREKYLFCLLSALVAWLVGAILTCAAYIITGSFYFACSYDPSSIEARCRKKQDRYVYHIRLHCRPDLHGQKTARRIRPPGKDRAGSEQFPSRCSCCRNHRLWSAGCLYLLSLQCQDHDEKGILIFKLI